MTQGWRENNEGSTKMKRKMNTDEKGKLIGNICMKLKLMAENEKKDFDYGDTLLSLSFKSDSELLNIAKLCVI